MGPLIMSTQYEEELSDIKTVSDKGETINHSGQNGSYMTSSGLVLVSCLSSTISEWLCLMLGFCGIACA